jgi:hypothetical protein
MDPDRLTGLMALTQNDTSRSSSNTTSHSNGADCRGEFRPHKGRKPSADVSAHRKIPLREKKNALEK